MLDADASGGLQHVPGLFPDAADRTGGSIQFHIPPKCLAGHVRESAIRAAARKSERL